MPHVLDVFFPRRCAACGEGDWPFCESCLSTLVPLDPPVCGRCGAPRRTASNDCPDCPPPSVDRARSAFLFVGAARRAVHRLKFAGNRGVADALGEAMAAAAMSDGDIITWVLLSRARLAERGYDQAEALAKVVGRHLGIRPRPVLVRTRDLPPQARRGGEERREALRGAFEAVGRTPPHVLLVDDVLTTGATAGECTAALKRAGAARVELLTAARAVRSSRGR